MRRVYGWATVLAWVSSGADASELERLRRELQERLNGQRASWSPFGFRGLLDPANIQERLAAVTESGMKRLDGAVQSALSAAADILLNWKEKSSALSEEDRSLLLLDSPLELSGIGAEGRDREALTSAISTLFEASAVLSRWKAAVECATYVKGSTIGDMELPMRQLGDACSAMLAALQNTGEAFEQMLERNVFARIDLDRFDSNVLEVADVIARSEMEVVKLQFAAAEFSSLSQMPRDLSWSILKSIGGEFQEVSVVKKLQQLEFLYYFPLLKNSVRKLLRSIVGGIRSNAEIPSFLVDANISGTILADVKSSIRFRQLPLGAFDFVTSAMTRGNRRSFIEALTAIITNLNQFQNIMEIFDMNKALSGIGPSFALESMLAASLTSGLLKLRSGVYALVGASELEGIESLADFIGSSPDALLIFQALNQVYNSGSLVLKKLRTVSIVSFETPYVQLAALLDRLGPLLERDDVFFSELQQINEKVAKLGGMQCTGEETKLESAALALTQIWTAMSLSPQALFVFHQCHARFGDAMAAAACRASRLYAELAPSKSAAVPWLYQVRALLEQLWASNRSLMAHVASLAGVNQQRGAQGEARSLEDALARIQISVAEIGEGMTEVAQLMSEMQAAYEEKLEDGLGAPLSSFVADMNGFSFASVGNLFSQLNIVNALNLDFTMFTAVLTELWQDLLAASSVDKFLDDLFEQTVTQQKRELRMSRHLLPAARGNTVSAAAGTGPGEQRVKRGLTLQGPIGATRASRMMAAASAAPRSRAAGESQQADAPDEARDSEPMLSDSAPSHRPDDVLDLGAECQDESDDRTGSSWEQDNSALGPELQSTPSTDETDASHMLQGLSSSTLWNRSLLATPHNYWTVVQPTQIHARLESDFFILMKNQQWDQALEASLKIWQTVQSHLDKFKVLRLQRALAEPPGLLLSRASLAWSRVNFFLYNLVMEQRQNAGTKAPEHLEAILVTLAEGINATDKLFVEVQQDASSFTRSAREYLRDSSHNLVDMVRAGFKLKQSVARRIAASILAADANQLKALQYAVDARFDPQEPDASCKALLRLALALNGIANTPIIATQSLTAIAEMAADALKALENVQHVPANWLERLAAMPNVKLPFSIRGTENKNSLTESGPTTPLPPSLASSVKAIRNAVFDILQRKAGFNQLVPHAVNFAKELQTLGVHFELVAMLLINFGNPLQSKLLNGLFESRRDAIGNVYSIFSNKTRQALKDFCQSVLA